MKIISYYTVDDLAVRSGLPRSTIVGYILKGRIPATMFNGWWLIAVPEGDAFLESIAEPVAS
ncbi:MAG: helix-turn-helix domain-containing protein [Myxococcales bacterium]|nr:helix-turn-helix domain-containing protein [Myxococcales bacterium]